MGGPRETKKKWSSIWVKQVPIIHESMMPTIRLLCTLLSLFRAGRTYFIYHSIFPCTRTVCCYTHRARSYTHTHIHTLSHKHTHTNTHTHTHTHTHTLTHTHTHTHTAHTLHIHTHCTYVALTFPLFFCVWPGFPCHFLDQCAQMRARSRH